MAGALGPEQEPGAQPFATDSAFRKLARVFNQDCDALKPHKRVLQYAHTSPRGHSFCVSPGWFPLGTEPDTWTFHPFLTFIRPLSHHYSLACWQQSKDKTRRHFMRKKEKINGEICWYLLSNCSVTDREGEATWRVGTPGQIFRAFTPSRVSLVEVGRSEHWSADDHTQA